MTTANGILDAAALEDLAALRTPLLPQRVLIIDTDIAGDSDDVAALAIACQHHRDRRINLGGVIVSSSLDASAPCCRAVLDNFGCATVPVYAYQGALGSYNVTYPVYVRDRFGTVGQSRSAYVDDVTGYRTLLAKAADASVVLAIIGAPVSISRLLASSGDSISPLNGADLVATKVAKGVCMMGNFTNASPEYNASRDVASTQYFVANWPTNVPMYWHDASIGQAVFCGPSAIANALTDALGYTFDVYSQTAPAALNATGKRNSWDPLAIDYAVRGARDAYSLAGSNGTVAVDGTGITTYNANNGGPFFRVSKLATDLRLGKELDALLAANTKLLPVQSGHTIAFREGAGSGKFALADDQWYEGIAVGSPAFDANGTVISTGGAGWLFPHTPYLDSKVMMAAAVIRPTDISATRVFCAMHDGLPGSAYFHFRSNAGKLEYVSFDNVNDVATIVTSPTTDLAINTWALVSVVVNNLSVSLRLNGAQVASSTLPNLQHWRRGTARMGVGGRPTTDGNGNLTDTFLGNICAVDVRNGIDISTVETRLRAIATARGITLP